MSAEELLESVGIYACEKHFKRTIETLLDDRTSNLNEDARMLFELRDHAMNFKIENTGRVVILLNQIQNNFGNSCVETITNVVFYAKILDALAILKLAPTIDAITLFSFLNVIQHYFPENFTSNLDACKKLYKNMRLLLLFQSKNLAHLKNFCENELDERWSKLEESFKDYAFSLVEEGFDVIHYVRENETTEDAKIRQHRWWTEFQHLCPTQENHENDETFKTFVDFVKEKVSKNSMTQ